MEQKKDLLSKMAGTMECLNAHLAELGYECHVIEIPPIPDCPPSGYPPPYPKKNAWIVWVMDGKGRISDLEVYDRDPEDSMRWDTITNYVERNVKSYRDTGNCESKWDKATLENLLIKFYVQYDFVDYATKIKALRRLGRIDEFRDQVKKYLNYLNMELDSPEW